MKTSLLRRATSSSLVAQLIDAPDLVQTVRALAPPTFSALVRHVGLEDAGEIVALATTEQLVAAFDEDLFVNDKPGERETFDSARFVVWLEVLLEAGDAVAAARVAELSEDFVIQAISSIVLVLDNDALMARMGEGDDDAEAADKAIESCLSEEIDGYLLISRAHDGWDAALALILALDRDHRPLLVRILDRCADMSSGYIDDLEALVHVLSAADSLAEDVEADREERRGKQGYVEPRAARNFLKLARTPLTQTATSAERDPITRAYFRDVEPTPFQKTSAIEMAPQTKRLLQAIGSVVSAPLPALPGPSSNEGSSSKTLALVLAMRLLGERKPQVFQKRMEEFAYLVNVIVAGASKKNGRFEPAEAGEAVLATVALGAELQAREMGGLKRRATPEELCGVMEKCAAEILFRKASSTLVEKKIKTRSPGMLRSCIEFSRARKQIIESTKRKAG